MKLMESMRCRMRLHRICRALEIKPYDWQKRLVIYDDAEGVPEGRQNGKTMAAILAALVNEPKNAQELRTALERDADFWRANSIKMWTYDEYRKLHAKCLRKGAVKREAPTRRAFEKVVFGK